MRSITDDLRPLDEQAFGARVEPHRRELHVHCYRLLGSFEEAEDLVQEAFLRAWRHRDQFRGEAAPSTWLTRIVINEALMKLRRGKSAAGTVAIDNVVDLESHLDGTLSDAQRMPGPDAEVLRQELCALLERKIDALPQSFRTVFMLRAIEEMSAEDTASCLGIPEATVRTRLFRARSLLRESIESDVDLALASAFEFMGERCDRIVAGVVAAIRRELPGNEISKENR